jgi:hypothetical protein
MDLTQVTTGPRAPKPVRPWAGASAPVLSLVHSWTQCRATASMIAWAFPLAGLLALHGAAAAQGSGLRTDPSGLTVLEQPRREMRLGVSGMARRLGDRAFGWDAPAVPTRLLSATVLGDFYLGDSGGLRATGGLLLGRRDGPWGTTPRLGGSAQQAYIPLAMGGAETQAQPADSPGSRKVPYLGLGYSTPAWSSGWGFSADLGLMALQPGALGQGLPGQRGVDEILRDLRLTPTLQFGVSYAF